MCKSVAMRRAHHLLIGFGLSLSLSGCFDHEPPIIEMMFGSTEFIYNAEGPAKDYIPNFPDTILHTSSRCEVELMGFNGSLSEGTEIAYFQATKDLEGRLSCLEQALPQGHFSIVDHSDWDQMVAKIPGFPMQLEAAYERVPVEFPSQ